MLQNVFNYVIQVKVEAEGLAPDTWYWYVFNDCTDPSSQSPVGRTRTFASPDSKLVFLLLDFRY